MKSDLDLLAEAYGKMFREPSKCSCGCEDCGPKCPCNEDCECKNRIEEAKKKTAKPDYMDIDGDGDKKESMKKAAKDKKSVQSVQKENAEMGDAYETILEFRLINKKFARRYNKLTSAMLKAEPSSEEYGKYKTEREDLVSILKDHGMSPRDLEEYLVKKEKQTPLPDVPEQDQAARVANQYKDTSYSDTADLSNNVELSQQQRMNAPQAEVATMPPDKPAAPAEQ